MNVLLVQKKGVKKKKMASGAKEKVAARKSKKPVSLLPVVCF